jgi:hypothetical protein
MFDEIFDEVRFSLLPSLGFTFVPLTRLFKPKKEERGLDWGEK